MIKIAGTIDVEMSCRTDNCDRAVEIFRRKYPTARITEVDALPIIGICECCNKIIADGDDYRYYEDVYLCELCFKEAIEEQLRTDKDNDRYLKQE